MADAVDEDSFSTVFSGCEWGYDVDGLPHTIAFSQRHIFINEVAKYFTIIKCKGMLDGLLEGLKYYEVLQYIKQMCSKILIKMFLNLKMTKKSGSTLIYLSLEFCYR
jgi:hypothetical protein